MKPTVKTMEPNRNRARNLATLCRKDEVNRFENRVNTAKRIYLRIAATLGIQQSSCQLNHLHQCAAAIDIAATGSVPVEFDVTCLR